MGLEGGYKIIDLKDVNITTTAQIIPGIYNRIKETRKVLLFTGLTIKETALSDQFCGITPGDGIYYIHVSTNLALGTITDVTITINDDDEIKLVENESTIPELDGLHDFYTVTEESEE